MRPRLLLLVLDGFALRHCTPELAPHLTALARDGASAPTGGRAVLASSTYPNHASLATGVEPIRHGIYANNTFTETGIRPAREVGARGTTFLDAARSIGLSTGVAVGDANILGLIGASRCDTHWPPGGVLPAGTPMVRGYAANAAPFAALLEMLDAGTDVVLCQLDNTDGLAHLYGPDSSEAKAGYSEADALVGALLDRLRGGPRWGETIVGIVSDHGQITAELSLPPIDLPAALERGGVEAEVIEEGSAALVRTREIAAAGRVVSSVDGVAGYLPFAPGILYVHARRGRGFSTRKQMQRGIHGCPETTETVCVATGGHPALARVAEAFAAAPPTSAMVPRILAGAVGLAF
ncbi:MAG TPA: alkaline phosphatase family protein [Casimicrobiaceae bacterium]|nr:alkaline phosphatase family protein [Casimicrobiaceae bacterium]